jgi:membrane-bound lytic murein transglycosylase B
MMRRTGLCLLGFAACLLTALSTITPSAAAAPQDWPEWLAEFRAKAAAEGISQATLDAALNGLEPIQSILERDRKQPEYTLTFPQYRDRVVTAAKIKRGQEMSVEHAALLESISAKYGVQSRFILAIWGIESFYGKHTGKDSVVASLATLSYDRRRSSFFQKQLIAALQMIDKGYIDLATMKGSWAGAMGQPQFIPTSYLAYAVDEDGDGHRDIWNSLPDIFGSIANYLAKHGWQADHTWGRAVQVPKTLREQWASVADDEKKSKARTLTAWNNAGVRKDSGSALPGRDLPTILVAPDGAQGLMFATYPNYNRILNYNPSHLYALAVGLLSDGIESRQ